MRTVRILGLFIFYLLGQCQPLLAQTDSTGIYVRYILSGSDSLCGVGISRLVALRTANAFPLLRAINDQRLYLLHGQPVTPQSDDQQAIDSGQVALRLLYPPCQAVNDGQGKPATTGTPGLSEVKISRANRLLLMPVLPLLHLFSAAPQKRMLAYSQLQQNKDSSQLPFLQAALAQETDADALRTGKDIYYGLQLQHTRNTAAAKAYIDSITHNWSDNAPTLLRNYAQRGTINKDLNAYAAAQAQALETRYDRLQKIQNLFSGLSLGSILILVALGLSIVYGLAGIINMAHGEFLMIGAYTTYVVQSVFTNTFHTHSDAFFFVSLPVSFLVAGLLGLLLERLVIRHLYSKPLESLLATWGVSLILIQAARSIFGDLTAVRTPTILSGGWQVLPHLVLPYNRLFIIALTTGIVALTYLMLYRSRLGMQIRAVTQNRQMSACLGIETRRVAAITFFIGAGLAGVAGCAMTLIGNVVPDMGQTYIVDSFLVVVTGGVGKLAGTIVAGLGIGFLTKLFESFFQAVYGKVFILLFIMLFMQYKPRGLFPDKGRLAED
ncbi:MAG TPA: urea ABC transporter permease subunit UrtB [Chitinophaga sp.]